MSARTWIRSFLLLILFSTQGCLTAGSADNSCSGFRAILISDEDVLSRDTADQILGHNIFGERRCGWKAPG